MSMLSVSRPSRTILTERPQNVHWAEQIFSLPLSSRTTLKATQKSVSFGPHLPWGNQLNIPKECKILFRR